MVQNYCLPLQKQLCLKLQSSPERYIGTTPRCSFRVPVFTSNNFSSVKLCPSVLLLLSILVTSPFVPSGGTFSCQVTRGHFFYSQTVPSFLLSLHSSEIACFCSLLSPWNAFSQVFVLCHPACLTEHVPYVCTQQIFFLCSCYFSLLFQSQCWLYLSSAVSADLMLVWFLFFHILLL